MSDSKHWERKLDPYSLFQVEEGLPESGVDVTIRLARNETAQGRKLVEKAGLVLHAQIDDVVVGHVANPTELEQVAELPCVREVQVSRALHPERVPPP